MEISDYIPNYPELDDPEFNNKIFYKKEFYDLRTTAQAYPFGAPGELWPHQDLVARFLSPYTPYNQQLFFHTPGTGKTCAAAAIVEINKQDPTVRKPVLVIVPNDTLVVQWKQQIATICTSGNYIPENYFSNESEKKLTDAEKTTRLNKLLRPIYYITTMERMRKEIDKYPAGPSGDKILRERYSNTIVIIDEAHNLRIQSNTSKKNLESSKGRYKAFHRFLHLLVNSKIMLLSGTPMFDRIGELPGLMNLLLPIDNQLPTGQKFATEYLTKSGHLRKIKNGEELMQKLVGLTSYIREGGNFPTRVDLGTTEWTKYIKTVNLEMSDLQLQGYAEAYTKDTAKEKDAVSGLWKNSRQAAVFVYKKNDKYLWGTTASELLTITQKPRTVQVRGRNVTYSPVILKQEYHADLRANLALYSAKYAHIKDYVLEHKNHPIFIFTPLVSGSGGAIFLSLVLGLFGYKKAFGHETSREPRYALITGDSKSSLQRKALIEIFNSEQNRDGSLIQVMIATKTISEGTSFINVRDEIVVSPYWNNSGTEQAVGRGLRADSLIYLPDDERQVTVQELCSWNNYLKPEQNIDIHMYKMSESKDVENKSGERILKKAAWDCPLNYDRNVRINDADYSRSCDYQKCNYVCYQTTPEKVKPKWIYNIPDSELDDSTFILYYSKPQMLKIVEKIRAKMKGFSFIDITGLDKALDVENFKLLVLAIEYIIENHVTVYNKWGQTCFLRRQGNMLFLSDSPTEKEILGSWYTRYPYVNQETSLSKIIKDELISKDLENLDEFDPTSEVAQELIDSLQLDTKITLFETLIRMKPLDMNEKQTALYEAFKNLFKSNTFNAEGYLIHDLEKIKLSAEYVDFERGEGGNLRCFKDGVWGNCDKKAEEQLGSVIKEIKLQDVEEIVNNPLGLYGIKTTDGKFQITDKSQEKQTDKDKVDARSKYRGRVCNSLQKWYLIQIYLKTGAVPPIEIDTSITNKEDLLTAIKTANVINAVPENATVEMLQKILSLAKPKIKDLCPQLERWFADNNLMIYR